MWGGAVAAKPRRVLGDSPLLLGWPLEPRRSPTASQRMLTAPSPGAHAAQASQPTVAPWATWVAVT
eukprot:1345872-Lingulodinium_polyedra.AAC.1